ncbi:MAG: hypothetical protein ABFD82_15225 [Syntrophaceae bacterium]
MIESIIDILLIEDNPHDAEWTLEALNVQHLANRVKVLRVRDDENYTRFPAQVV